MAANQSAGSAGLAPQMSIVNADGTPTVFFFRWLLNTAATAAAGGSGGGNAPGDDTQVVFNQGGSLSSDPTFTFHDGSLWLSGPAGTGVVAPLFNSTAEGADHAFQQKDGRFYVTGAGDGYFQNLIVTATFNSEAIGTTAAVQQYTGTFVIYGNGNAQFQALSIAGPLTFPDGTVQVTAAVTGGGGGGSVTAVTASAPLASSGGAAPNITITSPLPIANGGTGSAAPSLVAGANVTITGAWPNQTITAAGGAGGGSVTSVALSMPPEFTVTGSPVTLSGTLTAAKASQAANLVYASPSGAAGVPVFRALAAADFSAGVRGGIQTPWLQNINAAAFQLQNAVSVGIGTSTPGVPLDIFGPAAQWRLSTSAVSPQVTAGFTGGGVPYLRLASDSTPTNAANIGMGLPGGALVPDLVFGMFASSVWTERMRITNAGNVGIGTASPRAQLTVIPAATPTTLAGANQIVIGEGTNNSAYGLNSGLFLDSADSNYKGVIQALAAGTGARLLLNPQGGNVGIGTSAPAASLDISGAVPSAPVSTAGLPGCLLADDTGTIVGAGGMIVFGANGSLWRFAAIKGYATSGSSNSQGDIVFHTRRIVTDATLTEAARIFANGNLSIGGSGGTYQLQLSLDSAGKPATSTWSVASDARLKRNVRPLAGGLDVITKLRPVEAEYNGLDGTPNGGRVVSFLADEVRKILPGCVTSHKAARGDVSGDVLDLNIHEILMHAILAIQQLAADAKPQEV